MFLAGFALCLFGCSLIHPTITRENDIWFDADRLATTTPCTSAARTRNAPAFTRWRASSCIRPFVPLRAAGLSVNRAEQLTLALLAGAWLCLMYLLFRALRCRRTDATILTAMASTCAAPVFLFPVTRSAPVRGSHGCVEPSLRRIPPHSLDGTRLVRSAERREREHDHHELDVRSADEFLRERLEAGGVRSPCKRSRSWYLLAIVQQAIFPTANIFLQPNRKDSSSTGPTQRK